MNKAGILSLNQGHKTGWLAFPGVPEARSMTHGLRVALLLSLAPLAGGAATTRYVSLSGGHVSSFTTWENAATNIQAAVDVSDNGDEIRIAPGLYRADTNSIEATHSVNHYNFYGTNVVYVRAKNLTLRGDSGDPADVVIDGEGRHRGIGFYYGGGAAHLHVPFTLDSLTIANCYAATNGAAVYWSCPAAVSNWLINCVIVSNVVGYSGSVLEHYKRTGTGSSMLLIDTVARSNQAPTSVFLSHNGSNRIERCTFENNSAMGVLLNYGSAEILHSILRGNVSAVLQRGGGLSVYKTQTVRVFSSLICGNRFTLTMGCGGMYNYSGDPVFLINSTVVTNAAPSGSGYPGGLYGAIHAINSIVYDNYTADGTLRNYNASVTFTNSCTSPTNDYPDAGNIDRPPLFVDATGGNYRLLAASPCINAGTNQPWMASAKDLDRLPRLDAMHGVVDMGCYEYRYRGTMILVK